MVINCRVVALSTALALFGSAFAQSGDTSISSNFNGTAIAAGNWLWFNSVFTASGLGSGPTNLYFQDQSVAITSGGTTTSYAIPNAVITLTPATGIATTSFSGGQWQSTISDSGLSGNQWLSGLALQLPGGLAGGANPVVWSGTMLTDKPGFTVNWQWSAANYTNFTDDYNALDVKATDDNHIGPWFNSDHAGTPENFKQFVTGGARGGGGSNYTGSYSSTGHVTPELVPEPAAFMPLALGAICLVRRRRKAAAV